MGLCWGWGWRLWAAFKLQARGYSWYITVGMFGCIFFTVYCFCDNLTVLTLCLPETGMGCACGCYWVPFPTWLLVPCRLLFKNSKELKVFVEDGFTGCLLFCLPPLKEKKQK